MIPAIYHLEAKIITRGVGRSAVAASAYMSYSEITNEYDGVKDDYTRKGGLVYEKIFLPSHAPPEWCDRSKLWNAIEETEKTTDSDVEIIEPIDPDTDFVVDVITDYVVIEETISNNVAGDFEIVKAFDITMKNKDGVHVQPDGTVKVKLPLDWSKDGIYKVYRVNDDGTLTDMNAYREGSHMVFETDHFSVYVIVDESEKADEPITPDEPQEETKKDFFSKIIDWFRSLIDLIISWFNK